VAPEAPVHAGTVAVTYGTRRVLLFKVLRSRIDGSMNRFMLVAFASYRGISNGNKDREILKVWLT
jgi:hypothetical protein